MSLQTMEARPSIPDRKLLARLVLIREEARNMMGGGILDERNDRGFRTLPEGEVSLYWILLYRKMFLTLFALLFITRPIKLLNTSISTRVQGGPFCHHKYPCFSLWFPNCFKTLDSFPNKFFLFPAFFCALETIIYIDN